MEAHIKRMQEVRDGKSSRDRAESLETKTDIPLHEMRAMRKEHADRKRDEERAARREAAARAKAALPEHAWKEPSRDFVF